MNKIFGTCTLVLLSIFSIFTSNAGVDFFALQPSSKMQSQLIHIQRKIAHVLKSPYSFSPAPAKELHITLKEIGDLSGPEQKTVKKAFGKFAKKHQAFALKDPCQGISLRVTGDGLVLLKLKLSNRLTDLAFSIDRNLSSLYRNKKIFHYSKRMDFPYNGHITLGQIQSKNKKLNTKALESALKSISTKLPTLDIATFFLLKSNRPAMPRVYFNKGAFALCI